MVSISDSDSMSTNEQVSNKARKADRRIARTKKMLGNALISLILEGEYDAITVQAITDRANLSRATFYLHYRDKEELLLESLQEIYDGIAPEMGALEPGTFYWRGASPSLVVFRHVAENRDLYRAMFRTHAGWQLVSEIQAYLAYRIRRSLELTVPGKLGDAAIEILCEYMASALYGLAIWWLNHDPPLSAEAMAQQYHALTLPTLRALLE